MIEGNIVDKICLGHHKTDQAETVLLNIFRGSGLQGAKGMNIISGNYIRPMLFTAKSTIKKYVKDNDIKFNEDYTNAESEYTRNFLRNEVMTLAKTRFPSLINNLVEFSKLADMDDKYIQNKVPFEGILKDDYMVRIPVSYFINEDSVVNRMLFRCFDYLKFSKDIEKKHIKIVKSMVNDAENGTKINLTNKITVQKE